MAAAISFDSYQNEYTETEQSPEYERIEMSKWAKNRTLITTIFASVAIIYGLTTTSIMDSNPFKVQYFRTKKPSKTSVEITVSASSPDYDNPKSLDYLPWQMLIEPYRDQTLGLESVMVDSEDMASAIKKADKGLYTVKWEINGETYSGYKTTVNLQFVGVFNGSVSVYDREEDKTYSDTFEIAVKYVRREIRTLTDDDREAFFNALELLYSTELAEGKELYGDKFVNAEYLLYQHLNGAARSDCDHWHDGAGFPMSHTAITLQAEQALQSIDPSIAMPYWEYAQDASLYDSYDQAPIFRDHWFGAASGAGEYHAIPAGRWAGIAMPNGSAYQSGWDISKTKSLNPFVNAYGHMRSPWNNNPSELIGRSNKTYDTMPGTIPTCSHMSGCYGSKTYSKMANCLNGATHGPVHITIGGAWGNNKVTEDDDLKFLDGVDRLLLFKMLWRSGFTRCPESCNPTQSCKCSVPTRYILYVGIEEMLRQSGVWDAASLDTRLSVNLDTLPERVMYAVEDPGVIGEMFSSAASYDPSFWPVHGQLERLLSYKRLRADKGATLFNETWGYSTGDGGMYLQGICDWSKVDGPTDLDNLPDCKMGEDYICYGHGEHDVLEFSNFLGEGETYTNRDFYNFIHPWNDNLPYTYDAFDFEYCAKQGYQF